MTPTQRMLRNMVADRIEQNPDAFDMEYWHHDPDENTYDLGVPVTQWECGTTHCIAGHAEQILWEHGVMTEPMHLFAKVDELAKALALERIGDGSFPTAFMPQLWERLLGKQPTAKDAAAFLRSDCATLEEWVEDVGR